ncbi:oligopeptide/dipeptide ABC transporter ATP-binding protein [Streptomyces sp. RTd22]|uniref:oligopeptide/dipeptide ABC transporter ATP-binding protein n=1 Tax=Streptomyces sp. RTd22 TaxID=1841249 RepID=UPI0007C4EEBC|nr:ABC transporter ATP-binding protein [Streptomyces sp. RTd22]
MSALLELSDLAVTYPAPGRRSAPLRAVDGVSLRVEPGETVGLVGESGSGKSTIGRAVLGLTRAAEGRISFDGADITRASARVRRALASDLQVVFQDPYSSLNPSHPVGKTLAEPLLRRKGTGRERAGAEIRRLLAAVGLPDDAADRHPARFSGGQRQRVAIARALAVSPRLVVCDEPVSALDVSTQAQVINLLAALQAELGVAYLFIAHDIAVVRHISHRVVVLYRGRVMESGPAAEVCLRPSHPYTRALVAAAPVPDPALQRKRRQVRRASVSTSTAAAVAVDGPGCPFAPRCPHTAEVCWSTRPARTTVGQVELSCHRYDPGSGHPDAGAPLPGPSPAGNGHGRQP